MKYTQIPSDTFQKLQMNAGIFCKNFNPVTREFSGILGATTGGGQFTAAPEYIDFGEDIDNCPKNTKELKRLDDVTVTMSTTFVSFDPEVAKLAMGAADIDSNNSAHIIPRRDLTVDDFQDVWWVGDYSQYNSGSTAGYCAIHLMNALSTGGFQLQSTDNGKGQQAIELTGHYSMSSPDVVPYEVFLQSGTSSGGAPSVMLNTHSITIAVNEERTLSAVVTPVGTSVTFTSGTTAKATVTSSGLNTVVKGIAAGSSIVTASITVDDVTYTDTCTVVVVAAS